MTTTPLWTTALEMKYAALRSHAIIASDPSGGYPFPKEVQADGMWMLQRAEVFAWTIDTSAAALLASRTVPGDAVISARGLPAPICWWWFDRPLSLRWSPLIDDPASIVAMMVSGHPDAGAESGVIGLLYEYHDLSRGRFLVPCGWFQAAEGETLNALYARHVAGHDALCPRLPDAANGLVKTTSGGGAIQTFRFIVAACAWLQQRVLTLSFGHIERHRRKQLAREHNQPMPSEVKVIQLRRAEAAAPGVATGEAVEWSCRWVVNGHWRNQPYKDERRLIYILPYVKGPADMPLRVPAHTVYEVSR